MPSVEKPPGDRDAVPPRADEAREQPARARGVHEGSTGDEQSPSVGARSAHVRHALWLLALVAVTAGLVVARLLSVDARYEQGLAAGLGVVLAVGLAARSGSHPVAAGGLALVIGAVAVVSRSETLLAGAAMVLAVVAACLGVLGTTPAASFLVAVREVLLALLLATAGALGVAGFDAGVDVTRFVYAVLGLSLVASFALVYRLGGGLHGLGRRGLLMAAGVLALLVAALVYTAALGRWGSPDLIAQVQTARDWADDSLGAVPHPIAVLLGIPALAWGVSMRDRRRQGWWVCAFGAAATATATTQLVGPDRFTSTTALAGGYTLVLGLVLGFVVIRVDRALAGSRGLRSRRAEELEHRPEPPRLWPLH